MIWNMKNHSSHVLSGLTVPANAAFGLECMQSVDLALKYSSIPNKAPGNTQQPHGCIANEHEVQVQKSYMDWLLQ